MLCPSLGQGFLLACAPALTRSRRACKAETILSRRRLLTNVKYLVPVLAMIAVMAAALVACGSDPTATLQPTESTEHPTATAVPQPTAEPPTPVPVQPTEAPAAATDVPEPTASPTAAPEPTDVPTPVPPTAIPAPEPSMVTVTDSNGTEVVFESPPERLVVYDGAAVEMLYAIGEGDRIVGTHSFVTYPPETESIAKVGDAFNMDIEAIVALEPDLVYVFYDRFNEDLERAGLKVLYIKSLSHGFTEVSNQIRMWGEITGAVEEAEHVAGEFDERVHSIEEKMNEVEPTWTVYSHGFDWWTPGRNTLVNDVFELLKLQNVADFEGYQQINPEIIVGNEPDIIMADSIESVTENPVLSTLHMVEDPDHLHDHVFVFSEGTSLSVAGPRFIDAVEEFAAWVYPKLFDAEKEDHHSKLVFQR